VAPRQSSLRPVTVERRKITFNPLPCVFCKSSETEVVVRTDYVLYIRCQNCFHSWSVLQPGQEPAGT